MATPRYDALKAKVRDWSNRRDGATIPDSIIEDCIRYGLDDIHRELRIPQLEFTYQFTITADDNDPERKYTVLQVPEDLIEFLYLRKMKDDETDHVYHQVADVRTFLDPYSENYSQYRYVWKDLKIFIHPKLAVGDVVELHYYRRLAQLDALYSVIPENWNADYADDEQPYLEVDNLNGTYLYKAGTGDNVAVFLTEGEAEDWDTLYGGGVTPLQYVGKEAWNWLRDAHEKMVIFAALKHIGAYLYDDVMEKRYSDRLVEQLNLLNREEKFRRAKGGNVQINVNANGLI